MATTINDTATVAVREALAKKQDPDIESQPKDRVFWRYWVSVSPEDGNGGPFMDNGVDLELTIRGILAEHEWELLFGFPERVCRVRIEARFRGKSLLTLPGQRWRLSPVPKVIDLQRQHLDGSSRNG